jgi:hypothetical protein
MAVLTFLFAVLFGLSRVEGFIIARRPVGLSSLFLSDPVDPLDNLKESAKTPPRVQPRQKAVDKLRSDSAARTRGYRVDPVPAKLSVPAPPVAAKRKRRDLLDVEQDVTECEARLLRVLPITLYQGFTELCRKITVRVALVSLTGHIGMLLPTINYVRKELQSSAIPFLYLGPIVFLIPFGLLWLYENNIIDMSMWRAELSYYLMEEQASATEILAREEVKLLEILREDRETDQDTLKRLASCRLLLKIDLNAIWDEVMAIKGSRGVNKLNSLATSTALSDADFSDIQSREPQGNRIQSAVQAILSDSDAKGETSAELLQKLKQLQSDLDEADSE